MRRSLSGSLIILENARTGKIYKGRMAARREEAERVADRKEREGDGKCRHCKPKLLSKINGPLRFITSIYRPILEISRKVNFASYSRNIIKISKDLPEYRQFFDVEYFYKRSYSLSCRYLWIIRFNCRYRKQSFILFGTALWRINFSLFPLLFFLSFLHHFFDISSRFRNLPRVFSVLL